MALEHPLRARREGRILDPGVGQALDHATVETGLRIHRHVDVAVVTLEVDHLDAVEACELSHEIVVPGGRRIELEAEPRVDPEPPLERKQARRVPDPDGGDEVAGGRGTADRIVQREAALAQGEVERRALERPPAVEARAVADRLDGKEVRQAEQPRYVIERAGPVQPGQVAAAPEELDLVDLIPCDVLALSDVEAAAESHDDRDLREPARRVAHEGQELAALDDDGQPGDTRVGRTGLGSGGLIVAQPNASVEARRTRISSQICQRSSLTAAPLYRAACGRRGAPAGPF